MGLERLVGRLSGFVAASNAGLLFSNLAYGSFKEGNMKESLTYITASLISFIISGYCYKSLHTQRGYNQEETGVFGVPDQVIRTIEKRDSGRYHQL